MTAITSEFLRAQNDPRGLRDVLQRIFQDSVGAYFLCLGSTGTSDVEGISAAGATPSQRRLTPSVDADILRSNAARDGEKIPVSPDGIVSPVVIARSCLDLLDLKPFIVDCGTFRQPIEVDLLAGTTPAKCLSGGSALELLQVESLFAEGLKFGKSVPLGDYALIAECVPGGTTTAAAILQGFGVNCIDLVSTSVISPDKSKRWALIESGLKSSAYPLEQWQSDPLKAIASVGDPMQAFVCGMTIAVLARKPVVLGGGSQMLAVYYLIEKLAASRRYEIDLSRLFVVTTKWVTGDPSANTRRLGEVIGANFFASFPDFELSKFAGLRAYENWHVKEGLGAGALMAAAQARTKLTAAELMQYIDAAYAALNLQTA